MWVVNEHRSVLKQLKKLPTEILKRYEKWKEIVQFSGPEGLRRVPGLRDESLKGEWGGYRSSRLNIQYRVIYFVDGDQIEVNVVEITAHDYRRK